MSAAIEQLLSGAIPRLTVCPDGRLVQGAPIPAAVLPGSFNPRHAGHVGLAAAAAEILGVAVHFELSAVNVDKPALTADEIRRRIVQFAGQGTVELTRAPTFLEKARLLPGVTFVVGADTAERLVAARYYGGTEAQMHAALDEMIALGVRFLVAARRDATGHVSTLAEIAVPPRFATMFTQIPENRFRVDVSSTELRQGT